MKQKDGIPLSIDATCTIPKENYILLYALTYFCLYSTTSCNSESTDASILRMFFYRITFY